MARTTGLYRVSEDDGVVSMVAVVISYVQCYLYMFEMLQESFLPCSGMCEAGKRDAMDMKWNE